MACFWPFLLCSVLLEHFARSAFLLPLEPSAPSFAVFSLSLPGKLLLTSLVRVGHTGGETCIIIVLFDEMGELFSISENAVKIVRIEPRELCLLLLPLLGKRLIWQLFR